MKKLLNKKGFTLMEMLIVVAIIVILVAVSVPTFSSSLNNAKEATDAANLRAAKSVAANEYMLGDTTDGTYYYNADAGTLVESTDDAGEAYGAIEGDYVKVTISSDGEITVEWE